jgi:hypothetical protein
MSEVTISSEKLWVGLGSLAALVVAGFIAVWHERDTRLETEVEQIQMERQKTLEKYLETKDASKGTVEKRTDFYEELVHRLEALER